MTITFQRVQILGNLGAKPEIRTTRDGREVARLSVATNEIYLDKEGNKQERTEWHRVVVFQGNLIAKVIAPYLKEGSLVFVEGKLRTDKYTDKQGVERYSTDIILESLTAITKPLSIEE